MPVDTNIVIIVVNLLLPFMWLVFLKKILAQRYKSAVTIPIFVLIIWASFFISSVIPFKYALFRQIIGVASLTLAIFLLYKDRWPKKLFAMGTIQVCILISEAASMLIFSSDGTDRSVLLDSSLLSQVLIYIIYLCIHSLLLFFASFLFSRRTERLSSKTWLMYALFPLSQMLLLAMFMQTFSNATMRTVFELIYVFICIGADIGLYFAIRGMAQREEIAAENRLLARQINAQSEHYSALIAQYERMRVMRHDIANHVSTIQALLASGNTGEARAYAEEIMPQHTFSSALGNCQNPVADAFLFMRIAELENRGITVKASVFLPADCGIENKDLICALGNLIDNAHEACESASGEKTISISASVISGYIVIAVKNPLPAQMEHKRRIDGLERGVGFVILKQLAKRYNGDFSYEEHDGTFLSKLSLCIPEEC